MRVLITGGHKGIGLELARVFCDANYDVVVCGRSVINSGERFHTNGIYDAVQYQCDLGNPHYVSKFMTKHGPFHVVVNNANCSNKGTVAGPDALAPEDMKDMIRSNLILHYYTIRHAWKQMLQHQIQGTFINISSMGAVDPLPVLGFYGATKAWFETYSKAMAEEGAGENIRTIVMRLGAVRTPSLFKLFPKFNPDHALDVRAAAKMIYSAFKTAKNGSTIVIAAPNQKEGFPK